MSAASFAPGSTEAGSVRAGFGLRGFAAAAAVGLAFSSAPLADIGPARIAESVRPEAPVVVSGAMSPWPIGLTRVIRSAAPEPPFGAGATAPPQLASRGAGADRTTRAGASVTQTRIGAADQPGAQARVDRATGPIDIAPSASASSGASSSSSASSGAGASASAAAAPPPTKTAARAAAPPPAAPRTAPEPTARMSQAPPPRQPGFFEDPFAYIARLSARERPPGSDLDARQD